MSSGDGPPNTAPGGGPPLSYRDAGVDIDAGEALVRRIRETSRRTRRPEVLSELGGFGALCGIPAGYREPVLASATDGVGTKLKLAAAMNRHDTVGIDLVAMCVNDLIVCGAEPLFFLDYYAAGRLDVDAAAEVVAGIGAGCEMAGCALVGGETAEMPGVYRDGDYDLAGFAVGVVEKSRILDRARAAPGDALIGLASSGPHSNGYSLIRRIIEREGAALDAPFGDGTLGGTLLEPTRIYVDALRALAAAAEPTAVAHITGGGIVENLPRALPENCRAVLKADSWPCPPVFAWIQERGGISDAEMHRTFNCGLGMIAAVPAARAADALDALNRDGERAFPVGEVRAGAGPVALE